MAVRYREPQHQRDIALLIVILAMTAGAGRTGIAVTTDCMPVSAEIIEEQVSTAETPAEAAVSPCCRLKTTPNLCETEPETTDNSHLDAESKLESADIIGAALSS